MITTAREQGTGNREQPASTSPVDGDYGEAYPASRKVYVDGPHGIRVPAREIALSGGEPPLRVYDTSGPLGGDVRQGLHPLREAWIRARGGVEEVSRSYRAPDAIPAELQRRTLRGTGCVTQMHYARRGEITPEMEFIALREGMDPSSCAARSRAAAPSSRPTSTTRSWSR
jgi:phosphomethylpyrimidine synthase